MTLLPERFHPTYSATKSFVLTVTQAFHPEVGSKGVKLQAVLPGLTRTELLKRVRQSFDDLPQTIVMKVGDMVDAALSRFDEGELVTIPSLPDAADWDAFTAARLALGPGLSRSEPAARFRA